MRIKARGDRCVRVRGINVKVDEGKRISTRRRGVGAGAGARRDMGEGEGGRVSGNANESASGNGFGNANESASGNGIGNANESASGNGIGNADAKAEKRIAGCKIEFWGEEDRRAFLECVREVQGTFWTGGG